ncbi:high mobility group protein 20A [Daktulosphaira vitifoliae]|uniref:high mobility group protein 20A n=1 Tax=Daktulosphaira vitifoliae TaxID=58002 RepID=UPI0021A9ADF4|nr:high mobility group protein 20A [Daktulosphaira vitifoliae]XP_050539593.1 high mobility group protein 20A [Daktulosphaira vitifoliae]
MSGVKEDVNLDLDADDFGQNDDSLENGVSKKEEKVDIKSKKRKKCLRDKDAPRHPLSGYIRFLNDRRDQFRAENPNLPFAEITKMLATEWNQLPGDKKQQYLLAAEQDRVKYIEELTAYRKTDAYKNFIQHKSKKKKPDIIPEIHEQQKPEKEKEKEKEINDNKDAYEIPIYSDEFLNFNRARECELRHLRKSVTDQEQEVSVLDKHIENMNNGISKLVSSTDQLKKSCEKFEEHLRNLRSKFLDSFSNIQLPENKECPSLQNIDQFVLKLALLLKTGADSNLITNVKRAVSNLDVSQF